MEPFQHCTFPGCNRKYKTKQNLDKHLATHDIKVEENQPLNGSLYKTKYFYLCPEMDCNKKYKQLNRLNDHLLNDHKIVNQSVIEPVLITKENKKVVENNRNNSKKKELYDSKIAEIEEEKRVKKQIEDEILEKYKQEREEIERLKVENERLELELVNKINTRSIENPDKCSICFDNNADTAIIPCGHKFFCYDCIDEYKDLYSHRGCPICRTKIENIIKTFS